MRDSEPDLKNQKRRKPAIDRLPPHNGEAEQGCLCGVLNDIRNLDLLVETFQGSGAEVFYDLRHQVIFTAFIEMNHAKLPIDVVTLSNHLKDRQLLEQVGGIVYLAALPDLGVPSNCQYYADIVLEKYLMRKVVSTCTDIVAGVYETTDTAAGFLDQAEGQFLAIRKLRQTVSIPTMRQLVPAAMEKMEGFVSKAGKPLGIPSGFTDYDKMTGGLIDGQMIIIAARPSVGKTSLAMNIAEHAAIDLQLPVGVFSLEMTREELVMRMITSRARVNLRNIQEGYLAERDFPKLTGASAKLSKAPVYIDDTAPLTIMELRARARRMHHQYGLRLLVVDYLQLLHAQSGRGKRFENRQQEITEISNGLKTLAKELKVPVIVLSQLNRDLEREKNRRPRLSDLRESGAIEQDGDCIGLLYNVPKGDQEPDDREEALLVNLLIAKQRNGPTGDVHLTFLKPFTRFESAAKVSDEDMPSYDDTQQNLV